MKDLHIWLHSSQPDRVHYSVPNGDGTRRRLWQSINTEWGKCLIAEYRRRGARRD